MAASREEVFERVKEVLTEQLGVDENEITEEASFQEDLDADSLIAAVDAVYPTAADGTFSVTDTPPVGGDIRYDVAWDGNAGYRGSGASVTVRHGL